MGGQNVLGATTWLQRISFGFDKDGVNIQANIQSFSLSEIR
jgi:hypothetical protein